MKNTIINTTLYENNPSWLFGGSPKAIEAQEKRGQQQFVESDVIPSEITGDVSKFESLGIKILGPVENDPLFVFCSLPVGWTKQAGENVMWSDILNEKNERVAEVFYKASFYARRATIRAI